MITYQYKATNDQGKSVNGLVEAATEGAAAKLLISQGLTPVDVKVKSKSSGILNHFTSRVSTKDRVIFTRQLATLVNAGLPLTQSLRTVAEQSDNKYFAEVVYKVVSSVEGGSSLGDSLAMYPNVFNEIYIALVAAGESSGTLDQALERIATQQEKDGEMISKVRGAMIYPIIVLVVIIGVVVFLLTTVVPQIKLIYNDFNKPLPFVTGILLGIANILIQYWYIILVVLVGSIFFLRRYIKTKSGRAAFDRVKLDFPLFGRMFKKLYMARFCRTSQTLIQSGVPVLETLRITGRAINNVHVEESITKAAEKVKGGKALSEALKVETTFLSLVPQMLKIGEQSGAIDKMMEKAAIYYENELDNEIKTITTTIEPIMMVFLAIVVGTIVLAILLPVYGLVGDNLAV